MYVRPARSLRHLPTKLSALSVPHAVTSGAEEDPWEGHEPLPGAKDRSRRASVPGCAAQEQHRALRPQTREHPAAPPPPHFRRMYRRTAERHLHQGNVGLRHRRQGTIGLATET